MAKFSKYKSVKDFLKGSFWAFPIILVLLLACLTLFKIHGSSIGIYHTSLYDSSQKDPDLLFGNPKPIRSDEWKVWTPLLIFQEKTGKPGYNEQLNSGRDMTKHISSPVKDWVTVFRPHTWSYFVFPLEFAFSLQWLAPIFFLIFVLYSFIYKLLNRNRKLAVILSIAFALSPFIFWWYQPMVALAPAYALAVILLAMRVIENKKFPKIKSNKLSTLLYILSFSYIGACFGLLIYVPYLLPILLVTLAFITGYILEKGMTKKDLFKYIKIILSVFLIVSCIAFSYLLSHKEMINATASSVYPGQRVIESGGQKVISVFDGFLMPLLQSGSRGPNYYFNQSEASNFILLLPFLLLPGFVLILYEYKKHKHINWSLLLVQLISVIFLAKLFIHFGDFFYKIIQLDRVPPNRLLMGLGFAGFLQLILIIKSLDGIKKFKLRIKSLIITYCVACLGVLIFAGNYVIDNYPKFLNSHKLMFLLALSFTSIFTLFLLKRKFLGASALLVFTVLSSFYIFPVYKGLNFSQNSEIVKKIEANSSINDKWVVLDTEVFQSVPLMAGRGQISGQQLYPDVSFWRQIDKTGEKEYVYNRQAHALFLTNTLKPDPTNKYNVKTINDDLELVKGNVFKVKFQCNDFTYNNIDFALIDHSIEFKCLKLVDQVVYPKRTFFIYEIVRPAN